MVLFALLNVLLTLYSGAGTATALHLHSEPGVCWRGELPVDCAAATGALGGGALVVLLLALLAVWVNVETSLPRRRRLLITYACVMSLLCACEVAMGAWLAVRAKAARGALAVGAEDEHGRLLQAMSMSAPAGALPAAALALLALLQLGAVAAAAVLAHRTRNERRLVKRYSHVLQRAGSDKPKLLF